MVAKLVTSAAVVLLCAQVSWAQNAQSTKGVSDDEEGSAAAVSAAPVSRSLAGTWKGPTERLPLSGDFNEKVWGKNAVSVRDVSLSVKATGDAVLTVARKVLDARGRVVPGSASVEEADLTIGAAEPGFATRLDHAVKVVKAERTYPDDPKERWPLDDLRVNVVSFTDGAETLELRFEPADGKGSFSELLTRQRGAAGKTARR
jgi:hypothetical protein